MRERQYRRGAAERAQGRANERLSHTDSSMPASEINRVPYATDERDPETLQRISEPCPKCGSPGRVAEGDGVYWYCGKWYPQVSKHGGEPMTASTGNCDYVAALREQVTELELERIDVNALRTSCICAKECPATEHEYPPIEEDEVLSGLLAERDAETRRADDNYDAMKRAEAERDKERQINDYLVKRANELEAERDEWKQAAGAEAAIVDEIQAKATSIHSERDRYRAALERIAGEDYRGNRPMSATIAYRALNGGDDE